MKCFCIAAGVASVVMFPLGLFAQQPCRVTVATNVDVAGGEFSLADVLTRDTCPEWRHAAARVRLGSAPLAGIARVIEGNEVRALLEKVAATNEAGLVKSANVSVPERITVRRAGGGVSCLDLGRRVLASSHVSRAATESWLPRATTGDTEAVPAREIDCGSARWLPRETAFALAKKVWNPALGSWELFARCQDPKDCVPFLLRMRGRDLPLESAQSGQSIPRAGKSRVVSAGSAVEAAVPISKKPLVRRGEGVSLLWEQDGIRLVVRAISLDAGSAGEQVRARIEHGGRTLRAIVVGPGTLRATS